MGNENSRFRGNSPSFSSLKHRKSVDDRGKPITVPVVSSPPKHAPPFVPPRSSSLRGSSRETRGTTGSDAVITEEIRALSKALPQFDLNDPPNLWELPPNEQALFAMEIFRALDVGTTLGVSEEQLMAFVTDIQKGYLSNPYHSFAHAVDVAWVAQKFVTNYGAALYLDAEDIAALMVASLGHDPGYNNLYQINAKTELASRYENKSVLENFSVTLTLDLLEKHRLLDTLETRSVSDLSYAIPQTLQNVASDANAEALQGFENVAFNGAPRKQDRNAKQQFCETVTEAILATDMVHHFALLERIHAVLDSVGATPLPSPRLAPSAKDKTESDTPHGEGSHSSATSAIEQTPSKEAPKSPKTSPTISPVDVYPIGLRRDLCSILLHAADISNTVRSWDISLYWSNQVNEEFRRQGRLERDSGLPISPGMDPGDASRTPEELLAIQADVSIKFTTFIVEPFFSALAEFLPQAMELVHQLNENNLRWQEIAHELAAKSKPEEEQSSIAEAEEPLDDAEFIDSPLPTPMFSSGKLEEDYSGNGLPTVTVDGVNSPALKPLSPQERRFSLAAGSFEIPIDWRDRLRRRTTMNTVLINSKRTSSGTPVIGRRAQQLPPLKIQTDLPYRSSHYFVRPKDDDYVRYPDDSSEGDLSPPLSAHIMRSGSVPSITFRAASNSRAGSDISLMVTAAASHAALLEKANMSGGRERKNSLYSGVQVMSDVREEDEVGQ